MKKKFFALALAVVMLVSGAMTTMAATTELDCNGWWSGHTEGYEVTADGVTIEFTSTTYETAVNNWDGPLYVLFSADTNNTLGNKVTDLAGYVEYFVARGDAYAWSGAGIANADLVGKNTNDAVYADYYTKDETNADWDNFLANAKAGAKGTITAKLEGSNAVVTMDFNTVKTTATIPVDTTKTVYICLTGENTKLTGITEVVAEPDTTTPSTEGTTETPVAPEKGDFASVGTMVVLAGAALIVVAFVSKKKFA